MANRDRLRPHILTIVENLCSQTSVAYYMYKEGQITTSDVAEIVEASTNAEQNRRIFWLVSRRCETTNILEVFYRALEYTKQQELLAKIRE